MQRWLQDLVRPQNEQRKRLYQQTFQMRYQRNELRSVAGMDVPGKADALGLGWVAMREQPDPRPFLQKPPAAVVSSAMSPSIPNARPRYG